MAPSSIAPVELRGIRQRFGRRAVLRDVDLRIDPGEVVGLLGANGSGKTTLLSIIAGLQPPSGGQCSFGAHGDAQLGVAQRAAIAFVTHAPQVYPRLTARENLELFAELRAAAGFSPGLDVGAALERMALEHVADQLAGTFSRGMLQRLALARALAGQPELLLLDEPFTALDRSGRDLLVDVLRDQKDRGVAVLLCSHDLEIVVETAGRVALLEGGAIVGERRRADGDEGDFRPFRDRVGDLTTGGAHAGA